VVGGVDGPPGAELLAGLLGETVAEEGERVGDGPDEGVRPALPVWELHAAHSVTASTQAPALMPDRPRARVTLQP
jgi:hypothetical protein